MATLTITKVVSWEQERKYIGDYYAREMFSDAYRELRGLGRPGNLTIRLSIEIPSSETIPERKD